MARKVLRGSEAREAIARGVRRSRPLYLQATPFKIDGEPCRLIPLTLGYYAIVDAEEYENLWMYFWFAAIKEQGVYAARNGSRAEGLSGRTIYMHRQIMNTPPSEQCDHRFHNTLDNRKSQLRNCLKIFNTRNVLQHRDNVSGYKGVTYLKHRDRFIARIRAGSVHQSLGYFRTAMEAALRYDEAALALHGSFAHLNFPKGNQESIA